MVVRTRISLSCFGDILGSCLPKIEVDLSENFHPRFLLIVPELAWNLPTSFLTVLPQKHMGKLKMLLILATSRSDVKYNLFWYNFLSLLAQARFPTAIWEISPCSSRFFLFLASKDVSPDVCDSSIEIPYWWCKICPESGQEIWLVDVVVILTS